MAHETIKNIITSQGFFFYSYPEGILVQCFGLDLYTNVIHNNKKLIKGQVLNKIILKFYYYLNIY